MIRLRNGLGWVDAALDCCAMPPDGKTFAVAPGVVGGGGSQSSFHVVEVPEPIAVVGVGARVALDDRERGDIERLLADHVTHVAFRGQGRTGYAVVEGRGPPVVLATAAAALQAIGGWDETVPISIEVNGERIEVSLSFDGRSWSASATGPMP